ncbi:MAG: UDP-N-acetylmuramate--L-alanine ligase [Oscillatoria sp. PMC 1051.18]|nr:UDP-N-acetylmuramate--L-alanine ligase [Oscillatoria sp. PMC 1050.18]MEC5028683.1 UDP-N-acetylmuramate--L-alanine ligase [Oscillatoria sp. PMC 1051.18]
MSKTVDFSGKPFHFIGIGGIGMSALAYILAQRQLPVSGSDLRSTHITERLHSAGAHIFSSQEGSNLEFFQAKFESQKVALPTVTVGGTKVAPTSVTGSQSNSYASKLKFEPGLPQVICSTAISPTNSEYLAARGLGCPIFHRSDLLAALIQDYYSIAVAGTHGKTTTSSLIGYVLLKAGLDPTVVVGGEVNAWQGNARLGEGRYIVAEADESDGSLSKLAANIGVVTNIELDHPDHYQSLAEVVGIFQIFAAKCETLVGCLDCDIVREKLNPSITYSLNPESQADYTVSKVNYGASGTKAEIIERGKVLGELELPLLGTHNLSNALAAIAVGRKIGLEFAEIAAAIATFEGAKRRFELKGKSGGVTFIDDYAHHPSEIRATLAAARLQVEKNQPESRQRVVAIFQPHRYSRTWAFLSEFGEAFSDADVVVVTDIYSAGEPDLGEVSGKDVVEAIAAHHPQVFYQASVSDLSSFLPSILQPGDLALFLGAGNLNQIIPEAIAALCSQTTLKTEV